MNDNIHDVTGQNRNADDMIRQIEENSLRRGGSGPYDPGMEQRVAQLERQIERVESKIDTLDKSVRDLSDKVSEISGKISMLPGYPGMAVIMTVVGGGLLAAARLFPSGPPTP